MKQKIIVLFCSLFFSVGFVTAQGDGRILSTAAYSMGVQRITIDNALDVYRSNSTVYAIVSEDFDFNNTLGVVVNVYKGFELEGEMPENFSEPQEFKVKNTTDGKVYTWKVILKKLKKATLPLSLKFSSANSPLDWNNNAGWAYNIIGSLRYAVQLAGMNQCFIVACQEGAKKLDYSIYSSNNSDKQGMIEVETSEDGVEWENLVSYNESNPVAKNSVDGKPTSKAERFKSAKLPANTQYVRFFMKKKEESAIILNEISISK